ncbi:Uncharacterised protein [Burkholderia pseudomallei]|nr:Uncharacterised protein [Burkholderia pseudomallei]VBW94560.1 Uncharacterised protein [Burkholderia pseudomallei]
MYALLSRPFAAAWRLATELSLPSMRGASRMRAAWASASRQPAIDRTAGARRACHRDVIASPSAEASRPCAIAREGRRSRKRRAGGLRHDVGASPGHPPSRRRGRIRRSAWRRAEFRCRAPHARCPFTSACKRAGWRSIMRVDRCPIGTWSNRRRDAAAVRRTTARPHDRTTARPHDRTTARPHDNTTTRVNESARPASSPASARRPAARPPAGRPRAHAHPARGHGRRHRRDRACARLRASCARRRASRDRASP